MKFHNENFESPIEIMLAERMRVGLHSEVECWTQKPITAHGRNYRVDFYLKAAGRIVVIEADGKNFHDPIADRRRDAQMLDEGKADDVIRFPGTAIYFDADLCIDFIRLYAPFLMHPERRPLAAGGFLIQSTNARHLGLPATIRSCVPLDSAVELRTELQAARDCSLIGTARQGTVAIIQTHSRSCDKAPRQRAWRLSDIITKLHHLESR